MKEQAQFLQHCTLELNQLRLQVVNVQSFEQAFRDNSDKTKFYTGIANFVLLTYVFNLVAKSIHLQMLSGSF